MNSGSRYSRKSLGKLVFPHPIGCSAGHGNKFLPLARLQQQKVTFSVEVLLLKIFNKQNRPGGILKVQVATLAAPQIILHFIRKIRLLTV